MDDDVHTQLYLANSALQAIADLAAAEELDLNVTNGWRLACLLRLITDQLSEILERMGGDPERLAPSKEPG